QALVPLGLALGLSYISPLSRTLRIVVIYTQAFPLTSPHPPECETTPAPAPLQKQKPQASLGSCLPGKSRRDVFTQPVLLVTPSSSRARQEGFRASPTRVCHFHARRGFPLGCSCPSPAGDSDSGPDGSAGWLYPALRVTKPANENNSGFGVPACPRVTETWFPHPWGCVPPGGQKPWHGKEQRRAPRGRGGAPRGRRAMPWGESTAGHQGGHGPLCEDHEDQLCAKGPVCRCGAV
uniref:Uncharacterized protein n=1 Tax=Mustela putorius furo TaxID=9669 RepID=M3YQW0_MUSPF